MNWRLIVNHENATENVTDTKSEKYDTCVCHKLPDIGE